ncbi:hypothetical protein CDAR_40981 [Caerostris darwini]|uniref:Uncharacterized protein n=1 Tax=Caerostris darwini TaxID=1538125 RepID=A0AAV4VFP2_9ARAC|nr:hypothetical protein CDAR_40981 [Caerostris darwini]
MPAPRHTYRRNERGLMCRWIDDRGRDKWTNPLRTCPSLFQPSTPIRVLCFRCIRGSPRRGNGDSSLLERDIIYRIHPNQRFVFPREIDPFRLSYHIKVNTSVISAVWAGPSPRSAHSAVPPSNQLASFRRGHRHGNELDAACLAIRSAPRGEHGLDRNCFSRFSEIWISPNSIGERYFYYRVFFL